MMILYEYYMLASRPAVPASTGSWVVLLTMLGHVAEMVLQVIFLQQWYKSQEQMSGR